MDSNIISENRIESDSEYVKLEKACDMLSEKLDCDISVIYSHKSSIYKFVKRAFDITASLLAIVVLFPMFLISAIAIKLEDGGPVIYAAMRCGKDMKPFKMLKFRSMCVNAEEMLSDLIKEEDKNGLAYKIENDPRITKVGRFIRKTSIDELPQLINIIRGEMSIVGPRPIAFTDKEKNSYELQRYIVSPGLTCYWQISGRANIPWEE